MHVAIWPASYSSSIPIYNMDRGGMVSHGLVTMWRLTKIPNPIWYPGTGTQVQCCVAIVIPTVFHPRLDILDPYPYPYPWYPYPWSHTRTHTHTYGLVPIPVPVPMTLSHVVPLPIPVPMVSYPYPYPYPWSRTRTRTLPIPMASYPYPYPYPWSVPIPMASYPYPYPYPWSVPTLQVSNFGKQNSQVPKRYYETYQIWKSMQIRSKILAKVIDVPAWL